MCAAEPEAAADTDVQPPADDTESGDDKPPSSIDQELLDSLGDDSSEPLLPKGPDEPAADQPQADKQPDTSDDIDAELLRGLEEKDGASTGAPGDEADPLSRITHRMRDVQQRIARARSGADTQQMQSEIVSDLDRLIDELKKNANQSSSSSSQGSQQSGEPSEKEDGQQASAGQSGSQAARDSTARLTREKAAKPEPSGVRELMEGAWGRLPERVRQQMLQSSIEDFVPQYETLLREYFRSIATAGEK
jgi:hypothetical protein